MRKTPVVTAILSTRLHSSKLALMTKKEVVASIMFFSWSWTQKKKQDYTVRSDLNATLFASWQIILLLPAIPTGFAVNFFANIPIGSILNVVTEELVIRRGADEGLVLTITLGYSSPMLSQCIAKC